jgi:hypothetical protein
MLLALRRKGYLHLYIRVRKQGEEKNGCYGRRSPSTRFPKFLLVKSLGFLLCLFFAFFFSVDVCTKLKFNQNGLPSQNGLRSSK